MDHPKTMKVKPWGKNQGDHVIINVDRFDPAKHTPIGEITEVNYGPMATDTPTVTRKKKRKRKKKTG